jgi:gas vesicle protein
MNDNAKIAISILSGAVAGAVAGLLLAPNKGSETRTQLADGANRIGSNLRHQADRGLDTINTLLGRAESKLGEIEEKLNHTNHGVGATEAGRKVDHAADKVGEKLENAANRI